MANWRSEIKTLFENFASIAIGSGLNFFGPWNSQKNNSDKEETRGALGVFFEFSNIGEGLPYLLETNMQQSQRIPVMVTLHVIFSSKTEEYQDLAYDYADKITCEISGKKNEYVHGRIMKVAENEDTSHNGQYDYQISFGFWIKEAVFNSGLDALIDGNPETGENPATGRRLFVNINDIAPTPTPVYYNLTTIAGANGSVTPEYTLEPILKGEPVGVYAKADPGFKFYRWLLNTVESFINPIAFNIEKNSELIAEFIVSIIKQLTIAVVGNGTTVPAPGNYDREEGTFQLIEAFETDPLFYFDEFKQDTVPLVGNPVNVEILDNTLVVAYFTEYSQVVFDNLIGKINNAYYFLDKTTNSNNVQIKNTNTGYLNGIQGYGTIGTINYTNSPKFSMLCNLQETVSNAFHYSRRVGGNEFNLFSNSGSASFLQLAVFENGIFRSINSNILIPFSTWIEIGFDINNAASNINIYLVNLITGVRTDYNTPLLGEILQAATGATLFAFSEGSFKTKGQVACININNGESVCFFQEKNGAVVYDSSGNGNDILMTGINIADFHSLKGDVINPAKLVYGYERFENISTPGMYIDIIFANGIARGIIPAGYALKETIQPNAGFSDTGNTLDGLQIIGLETGATFAEVYALETTTDYVITKTATEVTQLKIK